MGRRDAWRWFVLLGAWLVHPPAWSIDGISLQIETIEAQQWRAQAVSIKGEIDNSGVLTLALLSLPQPLGDISSLRLHCGRLLLDAHALDCSEARISGQAAWLDGQPARGYLKYVFKSQRLELGLEDAGIADGYVTLDWAIEQGRQQGQVDARSVSLQWLWPWLPDAWAVQGTGQADLNAEISGSGSSWQIKGQLGLTQTQVATEDGRMASDALSLAADFSLATDTVTRLQLNLKDSAGQVYFEPIFADLGKHPLRAEVELEYVSEPASLKLDIQRWQHQRILDADGTLQFQFADETPLKDADIRLRVSDLGPAYKTYVSPFLIEQNLDSLQTAGKVTGDIQWRNGGLDGFKAALTAVHIDDSKGRFGIYDANGRIEWGKTATAPTEISWVGGHIYKLDVGKSRLKARIAGADAHLLNPLALPLAGGAVRVNEFAVYGLGGEQPRLRFDGQVDNVDLAQVTRSFGWPEFGGRLSGRLPTLEYIDDRLTLQGVLEAQAFDGNMQVENLRLEQPFGLLPRLYADIHMRSLDLEQVTRVYEFGRIEGRLDVDVTGLELVNWQPIAFDAHLSTPSNKALKEREVISQSALTVLGFGGVRRRISQRAVDNIANIGGSGAAGAVSRTFLRFFDDFAYNRIGWRCRLENGVCSMGGLYPKNGGYVLVEGRLLPRIEIIGYQSKVDWATLVDRIRAVQDSDGPVIE